MKANRMLLLLLFYRCLYLQALSLWVYLSNFLYCMFLWCDGLSIEKEVYSTILYIPLIFHLSFYLPLVLPRISFCLKQALRHYPVHSLFILSLSIFLISRISGGGSIDANSFSISIFSISSALDSISALSKFANL